MTVTFPNVRVGQPIRHEGLSVFPLFGDAASTVDYRLSDAAIADESLLVKEVSESGSVPDLLVENKGDIRVLFIEGEELIGAKQNRVLNASVLIAAHSTTKIPVSCVERGRWGYRSRDFKPSGSHVPSKLRRTLKSSVSRSIQEGEGYLSDQGEVWREVDCLHCAHGVESGTAAMSDAFEAHQDRVAEFREKLTYVEGAQGVAVAIEGRVATVDLFDKPDTCQKVWDRLLSGVAFDAIEAGAAQATVEVKDVEQYLAGAVDLPWSQTEAVGEGDEYRAESRQGDHASALAFQDTMVHGSVLAGV